ncbi:hypothetical protein [Mycetocola sp. 2940]|uniref:DUF7715 family protein n=1 Tax=Mycetocola sp. 2940 TaxID=3156452 RepID=UPI0033918C25
MNDYSFTVPGELVYVQDPCDCDRIEPLNGCGCSRGFAGVASARATTTAKVVDLPELSIESYTVALRAGLVAQGWPGEWAPGMAELMLDMAAHSPIGTIIERSFDDYRARATIPSETTKRPPGS